MHTSHFVGNTPPRAGVPRATGTASAWTKLRLHRVRTAIETHDLVKRGVPVSDARQLLRALEIISEGEFYEVLGINPRTMERRAETGKKTLDRNSSDNVLRLVSVMEQAILVLGSQAEAERWLTSPAIGLDQRKPIELLQSTEGTMLVKTLLTRMEYGVYA